MAKKSNRGIISQVTSDDLALDDSGVVDGAGIILELQSLCLLTFYLVV